MQTSDVGKPVEKFRKFVLIWYFFGLFCSTKAPFFKQQNLVRFISIHLEIYWNMYIFFIDS